VGVSYLAHGKGTNEKRAEPGDIVTNLPPSVIEIWLDQDVIEEVNGEQAS
jgi:hypothetical protein